MSVEAAARVDGFDHLGLRDRVLALRALDSLNSLDTNALALMAEHTEPRSFRKGDIIYREGQPIEEVQIVTSGLIRVSSGDRVIAEVQRGYGAGFLSVLARCEQGVDAVAVVDTTSLALTVPTLLDSFEQNFSLLRNALRLSAGGVLGLRGNLPTEELVLDADPGARPERPRTFVERVIDLRKNGLFASANVEAAVEWTRRSQEIHGKAGDVLFDIGDHSDFWASVVYGRMRCENADGKVTTVGSGFILGVMEALAAVPRQFRVIAETDYIVYRSELDTWLAIIEAHFGMGMDLLADMSKTLLKGSSV